MTSSLTAPVTADIAGLDDAPTAHRAVRAWVREVAELTTPARVVWCDGSTEEWRRLTAVLVRAGTLVRLTRKPHSFWAAGDLAQASTPHDHTYVCSARQEDAGPSNRWMDPLDMKIIMIEHYRGCMAGRDMFVVPFCLGPVGGRHSRLGVAVTDSAYLVACLHIMTRVGAPVLGDFVMPDGTEAEFVKSLHSVGAPMKPGHSEVPRPAGATTYVAHFPEQRAVWSYGLDGEAALGGSLDGGMLRTVSVPARDEGWLAERMVIIKVTSPRDTVHYLAAAFANTEHATDLALRQPTIPGWRVELLGAGVAWLHPVDGRLYAINPERGLLATATATSRRTHPVAMAAVERGDTIFTGVGLTDDGDVWWEGLTDRPPAHLTDWAGHDWTPAAAGPAAHPDSRFRTPIEHCPTLAPEWNDPTGVPLSAIVFGADRATMLPPVVESFGWRHGVFLGATLATDTDTDGIVRRDPMGMRDVLGYHAGDYLAHWLRVGAELGARTTATTPPRIFLTNWSGRDAVAGTLAWIVERLDGTASAQDTPIGRTPTAAPPGRPVDVAHWHDQWRDELPRIADWFATLGDRLPGDLRDELDAVRDRLSATTS
jgi:phosphoenolpyruvate carboxykinase (GTP)